MVTGSNDNAPSIQDVLNRVKAVLLGDEVARRWLYDALASPLLVRLRRRYGWNSRIEIEEILHDLFVQAYRPKSPLLERFLQSTTPGGQTVDRLEDHLWDAACGIASNMLRTRRRKPTLSMAEDPEPASQLDFEQLLLDRNLLRALDDCLRGYGERLYLYFKLRYADGYSAQEISNLTSWPIDQVYRLRDELRSRIEECAKKLQLL